MQDIDRQIRLARQVHRRLQQRAARWDLTCRQKQVSLSVYIQSKFSEQAAMQYILNCKMKHIKRKHAFDEETETLCANNPIRDWFCQCTVDELAMIGISPLSKKEKSIFSEAHHFVSEKYTLTWLQSQNISNGRAVTAVELTNRFLAYLDGHEDVNTTTAGDVKHLQEHHFEQTVKKRGLKLRSGMRKWCATFKRRWNVRHGQMMEREFMDIKDMRRKVGSISKKAIFRIHFSLGLSCSDKPCYHLETSIV